MVTISQLAKQFGISDRQIRKYVSAIRTRHTEIAGCRGKYPDWLQDEVRWIQRWGLATYIAGGDRADTTDTDNTAIAPIPPINTTANTDNTDNTAIAPIAPITPVEIAPCDGGGATQAIDALAILESRLSQAELMLAERSRELDDRARQRDRLTRNLALRATQLQAQKIAIDQREILEQALDSEAGKFAARVLG